MAENLNYSGDDGQGNKTYTIGWCPSNEVIEKAIRKNVPMYPELAVRELVANALIHQDFSITGTGPMIEIFQSRMEITNPGLPLVKTELYQLPAPIFEQTEEHTRVLLFAHKSFNEMERLDRIHACYLHACLKYVQKEPMTNATLRERFGIETKNSALASRVIKETVKAGLIFSYDETVGPRSIRYLPCWAK